MNPIFTQMISYFVVLIMALVVVGFLMRGFFWTFLRAKTSGGKLIMIKLRTLTRPVYKIGKIEEGDLVFKKGKNQVRINNISKEDIYRDMGVFFVEVDDETSQIIKVNLEGKTGFDPEKYNSLYLRALYRPTLLDQKTQIIIILLVVVILALIFIFFFSYQINKKVELVSNNVNMIRSLFVNNTGVIR